VARYGQVDVAVHNAGICPPDDGSVLEVGLEAWRRVQEVNLTSVYLGCRAVLPYMLAAGRGSIVNMASTAALMGAATSQVAYTASKGGVLALSRELGVQFARSGVRVNAVSPGVVATPLTRALFTEDAQLSARRLVHVPMGRFAEPAEVAAAVAFLASDDASFVTAGNLVVDGGTTGAYVTPV
jgi:NAD(P)-dependent dehydrogenase (short-subunit alcohol dehydrogenase family)